MESKKILLNIASLPVIVIGISSIVTVLSTASLAIGLILSAYMAIPFVAFFAILSGLCTLLDHAGLTHGFFFLLAVLSSFGLTGISFCLLSLVFHFFRDLVSGTKGE